MTMISSMAARCGASGDAEEGAAEATTVGAIRKSAAIAGIEFAKEWCRLGCRTVRGVRELEDIQHCSLVVARVRGGRVQVF